MYDREAHIEQVYSVITQLEGSLGYLDTLDQTSEGDLSSVYAAVGLEPAAGSVGDQALRATQAMVINVRAGKKACLIALEALRDYVRRI